MFRGTTPTLKFKLPFSAQKIKEVWITLGQCNQQILTKSITDCDIDDKCLTVRLSQNDTLLLSPDYKTQVQIRVLLKDDNALASKIIIVSTERILKDGEISASI